MYPSEHSPSFGIFVQNFVLGIKELGGKFSRYALIIGRPSSLSSKVWKYLRFYYHVMKGCFRSDYDIIYVHYVLHSALPLFFTLPFIKKPIVLNAHGDDILAKSAINRFIIDHLISRVIRRSTLLIVPSQYFKHIIIEKFNIDEKKIFVSPSGGVNFEIFRPAGQPASNKKYHIGYVSRIDKEKGWDTFIRSLGYLKTTYPHMNIKAIMVGSGEESSQKLEMINQYQLNDTIHSIDTTDQTGLVKIFNDMEVFVFPTRRAAESLGLIGIEAMACGLPVIGTSAGGLKDYLVDGQNGLVFKETDHEDLAGKIWQYLHADQTTKDKMSQNALKKAGEFDKRTVGKKLFQKLSELCAE